MLTAPIAHKDAGKPLAVFYGVSLASQTLAWVGEPDAAKAGWRVNSKGPSALQRIADKWDERKELMPKRIAALRYPDTL